MAALYFLIEHAVLLFGAWTLGHHVCILTRLPIGFAFIQAPLIYAVLCAAAGPGVRKAVACAATRPRFVASTISIALGASVLTLCVFRPDRDDYSFMLRTLAYVRALDAPFHSHAVAAAVSLPEEFFSARTLNSYEPLMAMLGAVSGKGAVWFYENVGGALAAFFLPLVYVLLLRRLRFLKARAVIGCLLAMVFLILDGGADRSFGNFAFVRLWQGKAILVTLILPLILLFSLRFLTRPSFRRFAMVFLACFCAVGLGVTSLYLVAALVFAVSFAYLIAFRRKRTRIRKSLVLNLALAYYVPVTIFLLVGNAAGPAGRGIWESWRRADWLPNVLLVTGSLKTALCYVAILLLCPAIMLSGNPRRYVVSLVLFLTVVFGSPIAAQVAAVVLPPASYWRLFYLLPVPLCFGLMAAALDLRSAWKRTAARAAVLAVVAVLMCWSHSPTVLRGAVLKSLSEYKLPPAELLFCRAAAPHIARQSVVLAPADVAWVLVILRPDIELASAAAPETPAPVGGGPAASGSSEPSLEEILAVGAKGAAQERVLANAIVAGADFVVTSAGVCNSVTRLLQSKGLEGRILAEDGGFVLISVDRTIR